MGNVESVMMIEFKVSNELSTSKHLIIVDVMNVVVHIKKGTKKYIFERLRILSKELEEMGEIYYFYPRYLLKKIDEKEKFHDFLKAHTGKTVTITSKCNIDNDKWILDFAKQKNAFILSNDQFKQHNISTLENRLLPFKFLVIEEELMVLLPWRN